MSPYTESELKLLTVCDCLEIDWQEELEKAKEKARSIALETFFLYEEAYKKIIEARYRSLTRGDTLPPFTPEMEAQLQNTILKAN